MSRVEVMVPLAVVAWVTLLPAGPAHAHGRPPATGQIAFHPSDPDVIVVRATFGYVVTRDGGDEWRWVCSAVTGQRMSEDPAIAIMSDGSVVATLFDGVARGEDLGCAWSFPEPMLEDVVTIDQAQHPTDPSTTFVLTSSGGAPNGVWKTDDDGRSWEPTNEAIDEILFETIRIAPGNPMRLYLSGAVPPTSEDPRMPFVYRSGDGGESWESFPFTPFDPSDPPSSDAGVPDGGSGGGDRNVFLLGVDPTDAEHLLAKVENEVADRLVRSRDGGESWEDVLRMRRIDGFAWSGDGSTVWVGGTEGTGLYRSDDGGERFSVVDADVEIGCLTLRSGELWACGNNFTDGFAVGRSADGGESFEQVLLYTDIRGIAECSSGETPDVCAELLPDLITDLGLPLDGGLDPDGGTAADGGPGDGGGGGGCGCRTAGDTPTTPRMPWIVACVAVSAIWLRRRFG